VAVQCRSHHKRDYSQPVYGADEERMFRDMPEDYVVLHCSKGLGHKNGGLGHPKGSIGIQEII
jgi:hypothetical protein